MSKRGIEELEEGEIKEADIYPENQLPEEKRQVPDNSAEILDLCQRARQHIANVDIAGFDRLRNDIRTLKDEAVNYIDSAEHILTDHLELITGLNIDAVVIEDAASAAAGAAYWAGAAASNAAATGTMDMRQQKAMVELIITNARDAETNVIGCEDNKIRIRRYVDNTIGNFAGDQRAHIVQATILLEQARAMRGNIDCIAQVERDIAAINEDINQREVDLIGVTNGYLAELNLLDDRIKAVLEATARMSTEVPQITNYSDWYRGITSHTFSGLTTARTNWASFGIHGVNMANIIEEILHREGILPQGAVVVYSRQTSGDYFTLQFPGITPDILHGSIHFTQSAIPGMPPASAFHWRRNTWPVNPNAATGILRVNPVASAGPLARRTAGYDADARLIQQLMRGYGMNIVPSSLVFTCVPDDQQNFSAYGQLAMRFVEVMCRVLDQTSGLWQSAGGGNRIVGIVTICFDIYIPTTKGYNLIKTMGIELTLDKDFTNENILNISVTEIYAKGKRQSKSEVKLSKVLEMFDHKTKEYIKSNILRSIIFFNAMVKNIDKIIYAISGEKQEFVQKEESAVDRSMIPRETTKKPPTPINELTEKKLPHNDKPFIASSLITAGGGNMDIYKEKYLKYKAKYLKLKNSI